MNHIHCDECGWLIARCAECDPPRDAAEDALVAGCPTPLCVPCRDEIYPRNGVVRLRRNPALRLPSTARRATTHPSLR